MIFTWQYSSTHSNYMLCILIYSCVFIHKKTGQNNLWIIDKFQLNAKRLYKYWVPLVIHVAILFIFFPLSCFFLLLGIEYKGFKVTPLTTCRQLINEALEKCSVVQDANLFAIYEVRDSGGVWCPINGDIASSDGNSNTGARVVQQRKLAYLFFLKWAWLLNWLAILLWSVPFICLIFCWPDQSQCVCWRWRSLHLPPASNRKEKRKQRTSKGMTPCPQPT